MKSRRIYYEYEDREMMRCQRRQESMCQQSLGRLSVVWLIVAVACLGGCQKSETPTAPDSSGGTDIDVESLLNGGPDSPSSTPDPSLTARGVLEDMVAAYKSATSYADQGFTRVEAPGNGKPQEMKGNCLVAMSRPNKIRLQVDSGILICDGRQVWASTGYLRGQVMQIPAPEAVTTQTVLPNSVFARAIAEMPTNTFSWLPIQVVLLLADDPLKTLLYQSHEITLLSDAPIDGRPCHRVQTVSPQGRGVFWIDGQTHVLRRFEFPTEQYQQPGLTVVGEYQNAQLNSEIDPRAFVFDAPVGTRFVEEFMVSGQESLGKPVEELELSDLEDKPLAADFLSGKVGVLNVWATSSAPCREALLATAKAYAKYKDNPKVAFMAVSIDEATVASDTLLEVLADWGAELPVFRDRKKSTIQRFGIPAIPSTIIVGPKGLVQENCQSLSPDEYSARIDALLAGQDLYTGTLESYLQGNREFLRIRDKCIDADLYVLDERIINAIEILPRTEPKSLKISKLWSCAELSGQNIAPGNVLVIEEGAGPPRILALKTEFGPRITSSVVQIGIDGKVLATHHLETDPKEPVMYLRTAVGAEGRRYYAASAVGLGHVYLFDEEFKVLLRYPDDATSTQHPGIGDVRLADLDGDKEPEIAVGYYDVVGLQCVSLKGERIWAERSLMHVLRIATTEPDAQGQRKVLCTNIQPDKGNLVVVDGKGKRQGEIAVPGRRLIWVSAADLDGDGQQEMCCLAQSTMGDLTAVGINLAGEELWSYPMPKGIHNQQIESVTWGRLLPQGPGHWILASPDGRLHILSSEGKLLDSFAYGKELSGLAVAAWDGKRVLLVDTPEGLDAWQVEPLPAP